MDREVPQEALGGWQRRQQHNRRREHDPLGEGQPCTWRTRLIKVAGCVYESTRRVVVQLSSSWPYLNHDQQVSQPVLALGSASPDTGCGAEQSALRDSGVTTRLGGKGGTVRRLQLLLPNIPENRLPDFPGLPAARVYE